MDPCLRIVKDLWCYWRIVVIFITPLALIWIPLLYPGGRMLHVYYCIYIVLWMIIYWMTEVLPLPVTSFLPMILFPMFGIMDAVAVAATYVPDINFILIGSFLMAAAIEESNLHKRIALRILLWMGSDLRLLMLGFQIAGGFLSMFIVHAAVTAMLLPCAMALINEVARCSRDYRNLEALRGQNNEAYAAELNNVEDGRVKSDEKLNSETNPSSQKPPIDAAAIQINTSAIKQDDSPVDLHKVPKAEAQMYRGILLTLCYSTSIGGTATLTGSASTIVLEGLITGAYPNCHEITYAKWIGFALLPILICLLLNYIWMLIQFFGIRRLPKMTGNNTKALLRKQYTDLGPMKFDEILSLIAFCSLVLLWFFRAPGFPGFRGWNTLFPNPKFISSGMASMIPAIFLFIVPKQLPDFLGFRGREARSNPKLRAPLLTWPIAQRKIPWGIIILVGGGYAMAAGINASGLSKWIGQYLKYLDSWSPILIMFLATVLAGVFTEFTSNVVIVQVFFPLLVELSKATRIHPLYLILPVVMKASMAFMLPVATPPNAIVFGAGNLKVFHMASAGLATNIIVTGIIMATMHTYGWWYYDLGTYPLWAESVNTTSPSLLHTTIHTHITTMT